MNSNTVIDGLMRLYSHMSVMKHARDTYVHDDIDSMLDSNILSQYNDRINSRCDTKRPSRLHTIYGLNDLQKTNSEVYDVVKKFADFKLHTGYVYLDMMGSVEYDIHNRLHMDKYVITTCFVSLYLSYILGDNTSQFDRLVHKMREYSSIVDNKREYESFISMVDTLVSSRESGSVRSMMGTISKYIHSDDTFVSMLVWVCKRVLHEHLIDASEQKKNSYLQKYYITDYFLFDKGTVREGDMSVYKMMRFTLEAFYISVESYCELTYIKYYNSEYNYKTILINKPKDQLTNKKILVYLFECESKHKIFCSYEVPDVVSTTNTSISGNKIAYKLSHLDSMKKDGYILGERVSNRKSDGGGKNVIGYSGGRDIKETTTVNPIISGFDVKKTNSPLYFRSTLDDKTEKDIHTSKTTTINDIVNVPSDRQDRRSITALKNIYRQPNDSQQYKHHIVETAVHTDDIHRVDSHAGIQLADSKMKLVGTRQGREGVVVYDREDISRCLVDILDEYNGSIDKICAMRKDRRRDEKTTRGRSFGRDNPAQSNTKAVRNVGRSQDVRVDSRYGYRQANVPVYTPLVSVYNRHRESYKYGSTSPYAYPTVRYTDSVRPTSNIDTH